MVRLNGELIAPRAREWLASAREPRIHSLYRQSVNLIDTRQGLLSVVLPGVGPGPFAVVAAPEDDSFAGFSTLDVQRPIVIRGRRIQLGNIEVEAANAVEWRPRPDWRRLGEELNEARVSQLAALLRRHAPPDSFAPLADSTMPEPDQTFQSKALRAAADPANALRYSLARGDLGEAVKAAKRLAGLGGGVTPSGDDYLQGAVHALWSRLNEERARRMGDAIVDEAAPRTNAISGEWLRAAARGEAGEDWHLLTRALASNRAVEEVVIRLIHRGHTSGADALAGFLAIFSAPG
ncbi:MAG: hypothetical protein BMS9Abin28_0020 [Anaerolineae bacterium]|nr:MAG: hypothetical protein BMS9Abin28_0020 [Anaerolineae bacterium]